MNVRIVVGLVLAGAVTPAFASVDVLHDARLAVPGPPPHEGAGQSVGYPISATAKLEKLFFGKRRLHPGATVGRHAITQEEVYYILSGTGAAISEEGTRAVAAGDAIVMKPGGTIELHQTGKADLVMIVSGARP
jgi:uncharacterized cupin superfamily protein